MIILLPVATVLSVVERASRRPDDPPSAVRQIVGASMLCLGLSLLALFGYRGGPIPNLDIAAFVLVIAGAGLSGLLPKYQ